MTHTNTLKKSLLLLLIGASCLSACGRLDKPSRMNLTKPQLAPETKLMQMPVKNVSEGFLRKVAEDYDRYGADTLQISLAYDPNSKSYGAMQAFGDLANYKQRLTKFGVGSITADTVKAEGSEPTVMIAYDAVTALAPEGCDYMPGYKTLATTRSWEDYRFGCTVDSVLAKQIYRPSDLAGNGASDPGDGRRASNVVEHYRNVTVDEAEGELNRIERTDIEQ